MTSTGKAKIDSLFINSQEVVLLHIYLIDLSHPQPPMPLITDNKVL